jgi:hypothetical protein
MLFDRLDHQRTVVAGANDSRTPTTTTPDLRRLSRSEPGCGCSCRPQLVDRVADPRSLVGELVHEFGAGRR